MEKRKSDQGTMIRLPASSGNGGAEWFSELREEKVDERARFRTSEVRATPIRNINTRAFRTSESRSPGMAYMFLLSLTKSLDHLF